MTDWFDELDLDPASTWLRMGTRALGDRPWLVVDERRDAELALKADLLDRRRTEVLATSRQSRIPALEVLGLVHGITGVSVEEAEDPLERAARSVQEDLCLLQCRDGSWHLDAACVCFPSRWRLGDKIGRPLAAVHAPTEGYDPHLVDRVERMLDRVGDRPVLRRNWFVHPDGALFQPSAPAADPLVPTDAVLDGLHLRSERQTLRRLPSGWILFTIRTQHGCLGEVLTTRARRARLARYLAAADATDLAHRGMSPAQVEAMLDVLG